MPHERTKVKKKPNLSNSKVKKAEIQLKSCFFKMQRYASCSHNYLNNVFINKYTWVIFVTYYISVSVKAANVKLSKLTRVHVFLNSNIM